MSDNEHTDDTERGDELVKKLKDELSKAVRIITQDKHRYVCPNFFAQAYPALP